MITDITKESHIVAKTIPGQMRMLFSTFFKGILTRDLIQLIQFNTIPIKIPISFFKEL